MGNLTDNQYITDPVFGVRETRRQREVRGLACQGLSNKEIGSELGVGQACIKYHMARLFIAWQVKNRFELLAKLQK